MRIKLFIICLLISCKAWAQELPVNIGFESGTFDGWQCYTGNISKSTFAINVSLSGPISDRHTILDTSYRNMLDPYGNFPILCPNGSNYSVKLGNDEAAGDKNIGGNAQRISYSFDVPRGSVNYSIIFNYAVVLEDNGHPQEQQPRFLAQIYDETDGIPIDCPAFNFAASSGLPGFMPASKEKHANNVIYYKDWSTASIDLKGYAGKKLRLEFTSTDCAPSAHFGYAYIDIDEIKSLQPITGNAYCNGQTFITLTAPTGFSGYYWYKNNDFTTVVGEGQSLTVSPAPPDLSKYAVKIVPYDAVCIDTLYTVVNKIDEGFKLVIPDAIYGCPGVGVNLTDSKIKEGSSAGMTYSYFTDILATYYLPNPKAVTASGTYYIKGVNKEGCTNILPINVVIGSPAVITSDPDPVQYPGQVDLSTAFKPLTGLIYSYFSDAAGTIAIDKKVSKSGTYYIKVTNNTGCSTISAVKAIITPPPPYQITMPNAFTPNNDGVNDHFSVKLKGYVSFGMLSIFNRIGQQIFTTRSVDEYWDGNYNGKNLPAGTYYWVFNATDDYYHTPVVKSGYIAIVR